ncbi:MAG: pectate lyase, partial [Bacteroidales bacterium]|nr:pectate lyase [Bacteroidales bacterium]
LKAETRPSGFDSDNDGMPDEWEEANGLNKNSNDAAKYTLDARGWYTNLECYLNWLVQSIVQARNADAITSVEEYYPSLPIDETDLSVPESEPVIRSVEYYSLDGNRLSEPADGICIRVILYRDGMKSVEKVIKR